MRNKPNLFRKHYLSELLYASREMNYLVLIVLLASLISCSEEKSDKVNPSSTEIKNATSIEKTSEDMIDEEFNIPLDFKDTSNILIGAFKEKVYTTANLSLFYNCQFELACDCCSGELAFEDDSTFYLLNYCMSDKTLTTGKYELKSDTLFLKSTNKQASYVYNYENEIDTSAIDYFLKDTIYAGYETALIIKSCGNKLALITGGNGNYEVVQESTRKYSDFKNLLQSTGLYGKIEE